MPEKTSTEIKERPLPPNIQQEIRQHMADAGLMVRVEPGEDTPGAIIAAIDVFLGKWQAGERPDVDEDDDLALMLGSLWGQQVVEALGWEWASMTLPGKRKPVVVIGVFSPDRAAALYPFHAVRAGLDKGAPVAVRRVFSMLMEGAKLHGLPARGYKNVMDLAGK